MTEQTVYLTLSASLTKISILVYVTQIRGPSPYHPNILFELTRGQKNGLANIRMYRINQPLLTSKNTSLTNRSMSIGYDVFRPVMRHYKDNIKAINPSNLDSVSQPAIFPLSKPLTADVSLHR